MAHDQMKPTQGEVWFDGGEEVPAIIAGTWNGFAVASIAVEDMERLFSQEEITRDGDSFTIDGDLRFEVKEGRVFLGDGLSLNYRA